MSNPFLMRVGRRGVFWPYVCKDILVMSIFSPVHVDWRCGFISGQCIRIWSGANKQGPNGQMSGVPNILKNPYDIIFPWIAWHVRFPDNGLAHLPAIDLLICMSIISS